MTALDDSLLPAIKSFSDSVGKNIIFFTEANRLFDASTQEVVEDPEVANTVKIFPPDYTQETVDGKEVQTVNFILAAKDLTITPIEKMEIEIDNERFRITKINSIYSGNSITAYDIRAN